MKSKKNKSSNCKRVHEQIARGFSGTNREKSSRTASHEFLAEKYHKNLKMKISSSVKRAVVLSGGAAVAVFALQRSLRSASRCDREAVPGRDENTSKGKGIRIRRYWTLILRYLRFHNDPASYKILTAMLGCAFVFSLVDVRKAFVSGQLFRAVFDGDKPTFRKLLTQNIGLCVVLTVFNKILANLVSRLSRNWHANLVNRIHDLYFKGNNFYAIQNTLELPHERIATDAPQLTRDLALISCDVVNSLINFVVFSWQVYAFGKRISGGNIWGGARLVLGPIGYAILGSVVVSRFAPNLGSIRKRQRELESKFKQSHLRLCRNAESIALYGGESYEQTKVHTHFEKLISFNENIRWSALPSELIKEYITKYALHTCMMLLVLSPFFNPNNPSRGSNSGQSMYRIRVLSELIVMELIALSQIARLGNTIQRVSGLVDRVGELIEGLEQVDDQSRSPDKRGTTSDRSIEFENVTINTPSGHRLVSGLTFKIKPGENFLICGPNGAGKSSILRCLGGLWPIHEGKISRPEGNGVGLHADAFYLPQRPYIPAYCTLEQCITYPDMEIRVEETQLAALLRLVELDYLYRQLKETGTVNQVFMWDSRLTLGEQQRLAIARLFFHRPVYAVLDECTSGVSLKMERRLFKLCRELGITLITISHRPALQDFHQRMLVLDGAGGYQIHELVSQSENQLSHSISTRSLADLDTMLGKYPFDKIVARLEKSGSVAVFKDVQLEEEKIVVDMGMDASLTDRHRRKRIWRASLFLFHTCWNARDMSKACLILAIVVVRTYLSNSLAGISGDSFRFLLKGKHSQFVQVIATALVMGFLQALFMPMLDILEGDLSEAWRVRITRSITERYFKNKNFYSISIPATTSGNETNSSDSLQPDQTIVDDVENLTRSIAKLWSECAKPTVDFVWFSRSVYTLTGLKGLGSLGLYMLGGSSFLSLIRPDLAGLSSKKERLDGEFLTVHARLSQCSESISFLEGGGAERKIVDSYLKAKIDHQTKQKWVEHMFGVPDQFVTFFLPQSASWILSMLYKETNSSVSGDLLIRDLRYLGSVVNQCFSSLGVLVQLGTVWATTTGHLERVALLVDRLEFPEVVESNVRVNAPSKSESGQIILEDVDVVPPAGERVLVRGISLKLDSVQEKGLMLAGCNGSGKSSVLKCMNGLIVPSRGVVRTVPTDIHFIPTKPYLAEGCIADQVTYPWVAFRERDGESVMEVLKKVRIAYLDQRGEGVFGSYSDSWDTKLSLGEQQRLAVARLLFHSKFSSFRFVFLDECTSAVALDGEEEIYREISERGLCSVTASQKPWLLQFHSKILQLSEGEKWELCGVPDGGIIGEQSRLPDVVYLDARQEEESIGNKKEVSSDPKAAAVGLNELASTQGTNKSGKKPTKQRNGK